MGKEYSIGNLEKPAVNLGDHGRFILGDITKSRRVALRDAYEVLESLPDDGDEGDQIRAVCRIVEVACEDGSGVGEKLAELFESEQIGERELTGLLKFVADWIIGEDQVGEA